MVKQYPPCKQCKDAHAGCSYDPENGACLRCRKRDQECSHSTYVKSHQGAQLPTSQEEDLVISGPSTRASSSGANQSNIRPLETESTSRPNKRQRTRSIPQTPGRPSIPATTAPRSSMRIHANASNNNERSQPLDRRVSFDDLSIGESSAVQGPSNLNPLVAEDGFANMSISNQHTSDRNDFHPHQAENIIESVNNGTNTRANSTLSEKKRGKQPIGRRNPMASGSSNLQTNTSAGNPAARQNASATTSRDRTTRRNSDTSFRQTVASGPSTQAVSERAISPTISPVAQGQAPSNYLVHAVDGYFAWPAIVMPVLVEDQFRNDFRNGLVNPALQIAVMCRGIAFTNMPNKAQIQRNLANKFLQHSRLSAHGTGQTLIRLRLDHLIAHTLMSRFTLDDSLQMTYLSNHVLPHRSILLEAIELNNDYGEIADATLQSRMQMLCRYLFSITALQFENLCLSNRSHIQFIATLSDDRPPFDPVYGPVISGLAMTAYNVHNLLNADENETEESFISNVHRAFEQLNGWRVDTLSPWMVSQLGASNDDKDGENMDDYLFFPTDKMRSRECKQESYLQIAVLEVVYINLFLRMADAISNTVTRGDREFARSEIRMRMAHTAARSIGEISYLTEFMAENASHGRETDLWMQACPFAVGDITFSLVRLMPDGL